MRQAVTQPKAALSEPPILTRPAEGETLYLYLAISEEALSGVLVRESPKGSNRCTS